MLHDNARPHAAHATRDNLRRFGWGVLDHTPCNYHVFGPLKTTLKARRFNSDEAVREAVEQWFIQQPVSFFAEVITKFVQRWDKCLNSGGQYLQPVLYCHPCVVTVAQWLLSNIYSIRIWTPVYVSLEQPLQTYSHILSYVLEVQHNTYPIWTGSNFQHNKVWICTSNSLIYFICKCTHNDQHLI
jgi:hypothetical protein